MAGNNQHGVKSEKKGSASEQQSQKDLRSFNRSCAELSELMFNVLYNLIIVVSFIA